jgi:FlaA1/EpsC-like NDP-sugar epimerase
MAFLTNKSVLVTGGCGTVGRELVFQILDQHPKEIRVVDSNESETFLLEQEIQARLEQLDASGIQRNCYVGDVRDPDKMHMMAEGIHVIFHVAGLKHVILCERSPFDAVQTNIVGVKNVISAALANDVECAIFTSSDKAVNPTNVMGTSKLMGERLFTAANSLKLNRRTVFSSTRFGNVLGSRGSVVPVFARQIQRGGPVTLTDHRMTRFVMTIQESCRLVLSAAEQANGGEVFVTKMPILRIADLAEVMVDMLAERFGHHPSQIPIQEIGVKAGEKLYEELMSDEETRRTYELPEMFVVLPAFRSVYEDIQYHYRDVLNTTVERPYVSSQYTPMTKDELRSYLEVNQILESVTDATMQAASRSEAAARTLKVAA